MIKKAAVQWAITVEILSVNACAVTQQDSCDIRKLTFMRDNFMQTRPAFVTDNVQVDAVFEEFLQGFSVTLLTKRPQFMTRVNLVEPLNHFVGVALFHVNVCQARRAVFFAVPDSLAFFFDCIN